MFNLFPRVQQIFRSKEKLFLQVMGSNLKNINIMILKTLILEGKILLVMDTAPMSADGKKCFSKNRNGMMI